MDLRAEYDRLILLAVSAYTQRHGPCSLRREFDGTSFVTRLVPASHEITLSPHKQEEMARLAAEFSRVCKLDPRYIVISISGGEPEFAPASGEAQLAV